MDEHPILWKVRTRWAAVGAAVAVVAGAGGIAVSGATNAQLTPSETAITPCRIMDTRASSQVGPRNTPLGTNTTHTIQVTGKNGNCNIPSDTSSVLMNVTLVSPAQPGFITVFPAGPDRPTASNLNYTAGQAPTPNLVKAALSNDGRVSFYASFGNVDLVADVVAYTTGARLSTSDLAQNRWDRDRAKPLTVNNDLGPSALLYDGNVIWVANGQDSTVSRIDPTTGTLLPPITVGDEPNTLTFDGTNVWVGNFSSRSISRVKATTGARLTPDITIGGRPGDLVYDGTNVWVSNRDAGTVTRFNATTGTRLTPDISVGSQPLELAYDGTNIWVARPGSDRVTRINAVTGIPVTPDITVSSPSGFAFDGTTMWVSSILTSTVVRINPATGARLLPDITVGSLPGSITFDGTDVWVANLGSDEVSRIDAATGTTYADIPVGTAPSAVVFDGTNIWVTNFSSGTIQRLRAGS